jgi:hypothetical protein
MATAKPKRAFTTYSLPSGAPNVKGRRGVPASRFQPAPENDSFSSYGVYQIGLVYARSCVVIETSAGSVMPNR